MYITKIYNYLGKQMNQYTKLCLYNIYISMYQQLTQKGLVSKSQVHAF